MPTKPATPCTVPDCPNVSIGHGKCRLHDRLSRRDYDGSRGTRQERGYGAGWQRVRQHYLQRYPFCALCGAPATDVHHIYGIANGHRDDNLMALCHQHHSQITMRELNEGRGWKKSRGQARDVRVLREPNSAGVNI